MAGLSVRTETNLQELLLANLSHSLYSLAFDPFKSQTYRWHNHLALETSSDPIVDAFWLSPAGINTFVGVTLVSMEALCACQIDLSVPHLTATFLPLPSPKNKRIYIWDVPSSVTGRTDVRFLTIGICFFAETIYKKLLRKFYRYLN